MKWKLCVAAWGYGVAFGSYRYTLKMLALERVRAKHFTKAWGKCKQTRNTHQCTPYAILLCVCVLWILKENKNTISKWNINITGWFLLLTSIVVGFIRAAESLPVLVGVPLTLYLNGESHRYGRAGYFVCSASAAISAILMFFIGYPMGGRQNVSKYSANGSITSHYTMPTTDCQDLLNRSFSSRYNNWYSSGTQCTSW